MTPEETALTLRALDIDQNFQVYIAAGEIYGGQRRMKDLMKVYPKVVSTLSNKAIFWAMYIIMFIFPLLSKTILLFRFKGEKGDTVGTL